MKADGQVIKFVATRVTPDVSSRLDNAFLELFSPKEQCRIRKLRKRFDFNRGVSGRLLAKAGIAAASDIPVKEIRFGQNCFGRPVVINPSLKAKCFDFNISHSGSWAVCAIARSAHVGVDVERLGAVDLHLIESCLTDNERNFIASLHPAQQASTFFDTWTCKEAYGKMTGEGITFNLRELDIKFYNGTVEASFRGAPLNTYLFRCYEIDSEYSLSLCVTGAELPPSVEIVDILSWIANLES